MKRIKCNQGNVIQWDLQAEMLRLLHIFKGNCWQGCAIFYLKRWKCQLGLGIYFTTLQASAGSACLWVQLRIALFTNISENGRAIHLIRSVSSLQNCSHCIKWQLFVDFLGFGWWNNLLGHICCHQLPIKLFKYQQGSHSFSMVSPELICEISKSAAMHCSALAEKNHSLWPTMIRNTQEWLPVWQNWLADMRTIVIL